jgi:hypothetical protein
MDTSSLDILSQLPEELHNTCKLTFRAEGITARYTRVKMVNELTDDMRKNQSQDWKNAFNKNIKGGCMQRSFM